MNINEAWTKALKNTEIIRPRVQSLMTFSETVIPYVLLSESTINLGDTVVRMGEILVDKPSLILPPNNPQFSGFDFEKEGQFKENSLLNFLLIRGITLPSFKYNNRTSSLHVYEDNLNKAVEHFKDDLQKQENVSSGLIVGPEDCWQFSVLIYTCMQIARNADIDIQRLLKEFKKNNKK